MFWRAVIAFLVLPGVVAFAVPAIWLWSRGPLTPVHPEGLVLLAAGFAGLLWCVRDFYVWTASIRMTGQDDCRAPVITMKSQQVAMSLPPAAAWLWSSTTSH